MLRILIICFTIFALAGCGGSSNKKSTAHPYFGNYKIGDAYKIQGKIYTPKVDYNYSEIGIASWYGKGFHGRLTANGATFNKNKITAAHRSLPLPSYVIVKNLENGKKIKVLINDRGPFYNNRIIDLSKKAAKKLGFSKKGIARVKVTILAKESRAIAKKLQTN